jgi:hypothetical protein
MSFTTQNNGRLCNQIIRNLATSLVATKHNLFVDYANYNLIKELGIDLYIGENKYDNTVEINNDNYFNILLLDSINYNINPNFDYFQSQEITDFLVSHLRSQQIKHHIMETNKYKNRYHNNNDVFIHIRLGDVPQHNPGLQYYLHCLSLIEFDGLFIATDCPDHSMIVSIKEKYPNLNLICESEINTIQFGSTCKHIILSHGSFSAVIGYLGFFSNVYYLNREPNWCPLGMFLNKGWNPIELY